MRTCVVAIDVRTILRPSVGIEKFSIGCTGMGEADRKRVRRGDQAGLGASSR